MGNISPSRSRRIMFTFMMRQLDYTRISNRSNSLEKRQVSASTLQANAYLLATQMTSSGVSTNSCESEEEKPKYHGRTLFYNLNHFFSAVVSLCSGWQMYTDFSFQEL